MSRFSRCSLVLVTAAIAAAQTFTGGITGVIKDSTGAVVPGASVAIRNTATSAARTASADAQGRYLFVYVQPGPYEVTVEAQGFKRFVKQGVEVAVDQTVLVEATLEVGALAESVSVTSDVPLIQTESAAKGQVITGQEIVDLPLVDRNWNELALLTPGVVPNDEDNASYASVNGARGFDLNFIVDGGTNKNMRFGTPQTSPAVESIQEFKMQTSSYSAEYGRMSSGILNAALKSGTNAFHGTVFHFLRNDAMDARNFFDQAKSKNIRNNFGGALGGPVRRDKLFFFVNYEGIRTRTGSPELARVATAQQRTGDFSELSAPILDPLARPAQPFANNRIPAARISPVARNILNFVPGANIAAAPGDFNFYSNAVQQGRTDKILAKGDFNFSGGDTLSVRVLRDYINNFLPFRSTRLPGFEAANNVPRYNAGVNFTHLFRPNLINQTMLTFSRGDSSISPVNLGRNYPAELGLQGLTGDPGLLAFPQVTIRTMTTIGDMSQTKIRWIGNDYQINDSLTWITGAHSIRTGFEVVRSQLFELTATNMMGVFNFQGRWTNDPTADFMLGYLNNTARRLNPLMNYIFSTTWGGFLQDDWKVTPNLTLNLGVRYDVFQPAYEKYDNWTNFSPAEKRLLRVGEPGLPRALVRTDKNNVSPRVGLAWRPFGSTRTSVRAGYGMFYGANLNGPFSTFLGANYPLTIRQTFNRSNTDPLALTLSNPFPDALARTAGVDTANGFDPYYATPYLQQYNFTVERQLSRGTAVEAGYVGSKGTHLGRRWDLNQPLRGPDIPGQPYPRPYAPFGNITYQSFDAASNYHSLQLLLKRRSRSLTMRAGYTWGKSLDTGSSVDNLDTQNSRDRDSERGRSDFDRRHALVGNAVYELPRIGRTAPTWLRAAAGGWQVNSLFRVTTGVPFTPSSTANRDAGEPTRPDRLGSGRLDNPTVERWFNPADFAVVSADANRFGNSGRNILDGPGRFVWDFSLMKHFRMPHEGHRLQVRWEIFNVPNHANFGRPQERINDTQPGRITSAQPGRQQQVALKYIF